MTIRKINEIMIDPSLVQKVNNHTTQLADKLEKGQVSVADIDKNKGKFDQTYMSDTLLQQITGTTPVNAIPADGGVTTTKLANKSVNIDKTNFLKIGKNIYNPDTVQKDMTMSSSSGLAVSPSVGQLVSDYIEVLPDIDYTFSASNSSATKFCSYDANKTPITTSIASVGVYRTHVNAKYIRINTSMATIDVQIEIGALKTAYEPFGYDFNKTVPISGIRVKNYSIPSIKLEKGVVGLESFQSPQEINLFDKTKLTLDTYVTNTGVITAFAGLHLSDFIAVKEGDMYTLTEGFSSQGGVYDANKNWITKIPTSGTSSLPSTFQAPTNGVYVRIIVSESKKNNWMMIPSNSYPSKYSSYGVNIPWLNQNPLVDTAYANTTFERWRSKKLLALGDSITWQDGRAYSSGQQVGQIAKGYLTLASEQLGLLSIENTAKSGASVVNDGSTATPLSVKAKEFNYANYDLVTILGGTNDWGNGHPLGTIGVIGGVFDDTTFCGAYQSMLEYIINSNNQIRIYMMTPLKRNNSDLINATGYSLKQLADKVKDIGSLYGIPVLDLYNQSMFSKLTFATYTKANDTVHPIDIGYKRISELVVPFLQTH